MSAVRSVECDLKYFQLSSGGATCLPAGLSSDLVSDCVQSSRSSQLAVIIQSWPHPVLRLSSSQAGAAYDYLEEISLDVDQRKLELKMKSELAITALNKTMQNQHGSHISVLDITNFPMTFHFLIRTSASMRSRRKIRVISDLVVDEQNIFLPLPSALNFTLQIRHLYVACYDSHGVSSRKLCHFLHQLRACPDIDLSSLEGLQISRLDLRAAFGVEKHSSELFDFLSEEFPNISSLDLSYNAINLNGDDLATSILQNLFSKLVRLKRLNIGGNRLTNKLPDILRGRDLHYLNLTGSQLRQLDVSFLAAFPGLNHLDLSNNKLRNKLNVLQGLLVRLKLLEILEMIDCELDDECLEEIIHTVNPLAKLRIINVTNNLILRQDFYINHDQCRIITE